ncbi:MAG: FAD-dependent oxidoreductase, partial [Hormoscilla sp.]
GLEDAVKAGCVENWMTAFHTVDGKTQLVPRKQPIFHTNRISLVKTLLSSLVAMAAGGDRLKLHFNCKCIGVDLDRQTILFESVSPDAKAELKPLLVPYDRLVGADGARSSVRNQFLKTPFFDFEQTAWYSCYKTLFLPSKNEKTGGDIQPLAFHVLRASEGINFTASPQISGGYIGVVFVPRTRQDMLNFASVAQVKEFFRQYLREVSLLLSDAEAENFMKRPISTQMRVRCSRYHHSDRVLLIGDAAHAVSSSTGQGCNSALEDAHIFASLLDEWEESWEIALAKFTENRVPDAHALWEIDGNIAPFSKVLFVEFILRERWAKIASRWFPKLVAPSLRDLIGSSTVPFAEILKIYSGWVAKVKASNQKIASRAIVK